MQANSSTTKIIETIPIKNGVVFSHGFGIQVKVDKGFLVIRDGTAFQPRERHFTKAVDKIRHLVILGSRGMITLSAFKWLFEIGASVIHISWDGQVFISSAPHKANINLRRLQYKAAQNSVGVVIAQFLISNKIEGQIRVMKCFTPNDIYTYSGEEIHSIRLLTSLLDGLKNADSISRVVEIESFAANVYWLALSKIPLVFERKDLPGIPPHWLTFGSRHSFINKKNNRHATNPANAMLNYLYALLYSQARIALLKAGFDPVAGILHADDLYRDSFVYDVMETVRSDVDDWLLDFIQKNKFPKKYFTVMPEGNIRLSLLLTPRLIETIPLWEEKINPMVDKIKRFIKHPNQLEMPQVLSNPGFTL